MKNLLKNKKILFITMAIVLVLVVSTTTYTYSKYKANTNVKVLANIGKLKCNVDVNTSDAYVENNETYFNVIVKNSDDNITSDTDLGYTLTITNQNGSKGKFSYEDGDYLETLVIEGHYLSKFTPTETLKIKVKSDNAIKTQVDFKVDLDCFQVEKAPLTLAEAIIKNAKELGGNVADRTKFGNPETTPGVDKSGNDERVLASTLDDYGTSYYFRGNVQDNFVNFANKCWRIVRIQGDNSVKLILEDKDNLCQNANGGYNTTYEGAGSKGGENAFIGDTNYGYKSGDVSSYVFDYTGSTTGAKNMLDNWLNDTSNIPDNDKSKLKTENWCLGNQTDWYDYSTGDSSADYSRGVYSETYKRLNGLGNEQISVTLKCNGSHDEKVSDIGGLLTADEVTLAGYKYGTNVYSSYLYVYNHNWWLATPAYRSSYDDSAFYVYGAGFSSDGYVSNATGAVRPAVVLSSMIKLTGGDGTQEHPYTV